MEQKSRNSILVIDDEANMLDMLSASLRREGYQVVTAANGLQGLEYGAARSFDFILCDLKMPVMGGLQFLEEAKAYRIKSTTIMMSAFATVDMAVKAMKNGAYDFITKPFKIDEILCILEKGSERMQLKQENLRLRKKLLELEKGKGFEDIVGESQALQGVLDLARRVASHDTTVLITGESGTGKELMARGIHQISKRRDGPFVSVNCGAIPANLLESEFFGYVKGAFTGADCDHKGLFEAANGGTLMLDEIGELPLELQVKLLRVLQEREVRPLAATASKKIDVRVLAATAKNLCAEVELGNFRQDLLFRINVVELTLPPLRERLGDIPVLVNAFIAEESKRMSIKIHGIVEDARMMLNGYSWPGNIRELRNVVEHAIIFAQNGWVTVESLPDQLCRGKRSKPESILPDTFSIKEGKVFLERHLIIKALARTSGNRSHAAELLEISYPSMLSKIKEYGVQVPEKTS